MSRRDGQRVSVEEGPDGTPLRLHMTGGDVPSPHRSMSLPYVLPILNVLSFYREWIGILDGEPERDVWLVETADGICEIHRLRDPTRAVAEAEAGSFTRLPASASAGEAVDVPPVPDRWVLARRED